MVQFKKKIHGSGTTVNFSNEEINDMTKIVKALEDSDILVKGATNTLQNDVKKGGALTILPPLLGSLGVSFLSGSEMYRAGEGKGLFRAGQGILKKALMPPHPLTNFEIINYYKNEPRFNGVYSRNTLPKLKNGAYVVNLDQYADSGTHWIGLYLKNNEAIYYDSFGAEYVPKEIIFFFGNKDIKTNTFRIQAYDSTMYCYFCISFIEFMFKGKILNDFTNLFSPHDF